MCGRMKRDETCHARELPKERGLVITITLWHTKHQVFPGIAGRIEEKPHIQSKGPITLRVVYDLMTKAGENGLSDDWMKYKISFKADPPEGAHAI